MKTKWLQEDISLKHCDLLLELQRQNKGIQMDVVEFSTESLLLWSVS